MSHFWNNYMEADKTYCGNKVYQGEDLAMVLTEEGYCQYDGNDYFFFLKDHLGNTRVTFNKGGAVQQVTNYYPFGAVMAESPRRTDQDEQPYKFGNKELDRMYGLDMYDFVARGYYAALGSFTTMDPLCEDDYSVSPYVYCRNNPLKYIDPTGEEAWKVTREWTEEDINKFAEFASKQLKQYEGEKIDCADLALNVLIDFSSENGLPMIINTADGRHFDASSENYNSVDDYKNGYTNDKGDKEGGVLPNVQARDISSNTFTLDKKNAQPGDMVILTTPANHIVNYSQTSPTRKLTYGNLDGNNKPSAVKTSKTDWTRITRDDNGTVFKYNPNSKTVHRWNYLKH